jgi:hypothetical protein
LDRGPKNGGGWSRPVFIGVNPSTADATQDDATIRKLKGFLQRWGMQPTFTIINLFSYRATDVRELATCEHPKGLDHDYYVNEAINDAGMLIPCWGDQTKLPLALRGEIDTMLRRVRNSEKPVYVFGRTKLGDPMHPLMLPYSTNMVPFK